MISHLDEFFGPDVVARELDLAGCWYLLASVDGEYPDVKIGSYPRSEGEDHRVWVTVEAAEKALVESTVNRLLEVLEDDEIIRVERP